MNAHSVASRERETKTGHKKVKTANMNVDYWNVDEGNPRVNRLCEELAKNRSLDSEIGVDPPGLLPKVPTFGTNQMRDTTTRQNSLAK